MINRKRSSGNIFNPNHATITFKVKYQTSFGQEVRVAGNIEELGSWEPTKSILMETTDELYPYWTSTQEITGPVGMEIYYKYVIYDKNLKKYIWENEDNSNRFFVINLPGRFELNDEQGNKECKVKRIGDDNLDEIIPFIANEDNTDQIGTCDFGNFSLLKNEIFEMLSYDSVKLEANNIKDTQIMDLSLKITAEDRLIIVSALLPFDIIKNTEGNFEIKINDENMIYSLMYGMKQKNICDVIWIGMLKNFQSFTEDELNDIYDYLVDNNIYMVMVDSDVYTNYWIYINKILKSVFVENSIDVKNEYFLNYEDFFKAFLYVNQQFGSTISNVMQKSDLIMINDIHLLLVPNCLLQKNTNAKVGIYFHSTFPSSDVLKTFPYHQEILKSILLCDVVGFHVFQNARHFLTSVQRILGLFYEIKIHGFIIISNLGRVVLVRIMHAGNDFDLLRNVLGSENVKNELQRINKKYPKKYTFVSIDLLEYSSELYIKFEAFRKFCKDYENGKNFCFIQIIKYDPSQENWEKKYECLIAITNTINNELGTQVIYLEKTESFGIVERYSLLARSDCLFYLQCGEGSCMYSQEYIAILNELKSNKYGIILSENIGVSNAIKGVISVNSYDVNSIKNGLERVYNMPLARRIDLLKKDIEYISKNSIMHWLKSFFIDLKRISEGESNNKIGISMGLNYMLMKLNSKFTHLNKVNIVETYRNSSKRLIFLDYEGTLQAVENDNNFDTDPNTNMPSKNLLSLLTLLCDDPCNKVYIVSGRQRNFLTHWFGSIPKLGIAAEYGFFYKNPGHNYNNEEFQQSIVVNDWSWKESVLKILQGFTEKTEGSYITQKDTMLSWIYKNSDVYFGHLQANEITTHLENILSGTSLIATHGKGYVDIKRKNVNKGFFISHIIKEEFLSEIEPDLILAIGDEDSDEEMFKYLNYIQGKLSYVKSETKIITCTIGRKPSEAKYYLNESNEVIDCLESMVL